MKINFMCTECIMLASSPTNTYKMNEGIFVDLPISDTGLYEFECNTLFRHKNKVQLTNLKSDLLFDSGINAYRDGYLREAISSFYAALENFYVEIIKYFLSHSSTKIDTKERDTFIKSPLKQSERKLGAFYGLYLFYLGEYPPIFNNDLVNRRNNVIHGTYYPKDSDVKEFGNAVARYIFSILKTLTLDKPNAFNEIEKVNMPVIADSAAYSSSKQRGYISHYQNKANHPVIDFTEFRTNYINNKK